MMRLILKAFTAVLFILIFIWISGYPAFIAYTVNIHPVDRTQHTDAIVVLTGGDNRIHTGLELLTAGLAPKLFISGVNKDVTIDDIMATWKGRDKLPTPHCCIILGHQALTTFENAKETKQWIADNNIKSIRLVTSRYHMARALLEFKMIIDEDITIVPHPVEQQYTGVTDGKFWKLTFSEYNKTLYRLLKIAAKNLANTDYKKLYDDLSSRWQK